MSTRTIATSAALAALAAFTAGCSGEEKPDGNKYGPKAGATSTANAATTATAAAKGVDKSKSAPTGTGVLTGVVRLAGTPPAMKVPKKRKDAELCKDKDVVYNAVVVNDGKLADVFVAIADGQIEGDFSAAGPAKVDQQDCVYVPRVQGILAGQPVEIHNSDATLHNVNARALDKLLFNRAQPKGAAAIKSEKFEDPGIYRLQCDVHPWMRSFVIASDNPYFAVTGQDGSYTIEKVPDGKFTVYAWHSMYGRIDKQGIEVKGGEVTVDFEYTGNEPEPPENTGELKDLW